MVEVKCERNKAFERTRYLLRAELPDLATDGKELKAGVIGCGGRGSGAAFNFLNAANGVTIVALGDTFQERVDEFGKEIKRMRKELMYRLINVSSAWMHTNK